MSRFSGPQGRGARRKVRETKRKEAEAREKIRKALVEQTEKAAVKAELALEKVEVSDADS